MLDYLNLVPADKARHFLAGALLALIPAVLGFPLIAILVVGIAGASKELFDLVTKKGTPDLFDVFWTIMGGAAVTLPAWSKSCQVV